MAALVTRAGEPSAGRAECFADERDEPRGTFDAGGVLL
jgi:hypothetical protein